MKGFVIRRAEEPSLAPLLIFASDIGTRVRRQCCFISCKLLQYDIFEQHLWGNCRDSDILGMADEGVSSPAEMLLPTQNFAWILCV